MEEYLSFKERRIYIYSAQLILQHVSILYTIFDNVFWRESFLFSVIEQYKVRKSLVKYVVGVLFIQLNLYDGS